LAGDAGDRAFGEHELIQSGSPPGNHLLEPFFFMTGAGSVVKGPAPAIFGLMEDERYRMLMQKSMALVEHLHSDFLVVGEGIASQVERAMKVNAELAL
jgi:hypothetical protein